MGRSIPPFIFEFEALNAAGKNQKGSVTAINSEDAIAQIKSIGFFPTSIKNTYKIGEPLASKPITAADARKKTAEALNAIDQMAEMKPFIEQIEQRILEATSKGLSSIMNPFHNFKDASGKNVWPPSNADELLSREFRKRGFNIQNHPDADPGHPGSAPYTTLSW